MRGAGTLNLPGEGRGHPGLLCSEGSPAAPAGRGAPFTSDHGVPVTARLTSEGEGFFPHPPATPFYSPDAAAACSTIYPPTHPPTHLCRRRPRRSSGVPVRVARPAPSCVPFPQSHEPSSATSPAEQHAPASEPAGPSSGPRRAASLRRKLRRATAPPRPAALPRRPFSGPFRGGPLITHPLRGAGALVVPFDHRGGPAPPRPPLSGALTAGARCVCVGGALRRAAEETKKRGYRHGPPSRQGHDPWASPARLYLIAPISKPKRKSDFDSDGIHAACPTNTEPLNPPFSCSKTFVPAFN